MANEIKQIKINSTTYDINAVKFNGQDASYYATVAEIGDISTALDTLIARTEAIIGAQYYIAQEETIEEEGEEVNE